MKLSDHRVGATVCVAEMDRAREFYEGKLELPVENDMGEAVVYGAGEGSSLLVYASPEHAGKATATVATWGVEDVEGTVDELAARGVEFASYGEPTPTNEKGIHKGEVGPTVAWMRDPAATSSPSPGSRPGLPFPEPMRVSAAGCEAAGQL